MNSHQKELIKNALTHDEHKTFGRGHGKGDEPKVWGGADAFASSLSRPHAPPGKNRRQELKKLDQTTGNTHYRISLLTRNTMYREGYIDLQNIDTTRSQLFDQSRKLHTLHNDWLHGYTAALFNESWFYPYTSLKYHTLITTALVMNGAVDNTNFDDLYLHLSTDAEDDYYTIYSHNQLVLKIAPWNAVDSDGYAKLPTLNHGKKSWMNFGTIWSRLTTIKGVDRELDAILRNRRSWSTALQFMEDTKKYGWNAKQAISKAAAQIARNEVTQ